MMGNDAAWKTIGISSIHMKMFDGQVRTLKDVRHVSDHKKNLLLFGTLEAQSYKFSGTDGVLKVTKSSMMVVKGEHTINLYKVIGNVVIGDAFLEIENEDTTRL